MKKNLGLFLVFCGLFYFTYQYEEIGGRNKKEFEIIKKQAFDFSDLGEMKGFMTPGSQIVFKSNKAYTQNKNILVDKAKLNEFFERLASMHILRVVPRQTESQQKINEVDFMGDNPIPFSFKFQNKSVQFLLGMKASFDQSFYIKVTKEGENSQILLVEDKRPLEGAFSKKGFESSDHKYKRLQSILYLKNDFFWERGVFKNIVNTDSLLKVGFLSERNPKFSLDLTKLNTVPKPPEGINIDQSEIKKLIKYFDNTRAEDVFVLLESDKLKNKRGELHFLYKENKILDFDIFSEFRGIKGTFIKREGQVFSISKKDVPFLFSNVQQFWSKKIDLPKKNYHLTLSLPSKEKLSFDILSHKSNNKGVDLILSYFNKDADKVSLVDLDIIKILQNVKSNNVLNLTLDRMKFAVVVDAHETKIINLAKNYVLHFFGNSDILNTLAKLKQEEI